jgi:hypothetical protein
LPADELLRFESVQDAAQRGLVHQDHATQLDLIEPLTVVECGEDEPVTHVPQPHRGRSDVQVGRHEAADGVKQEPHVTWTVQSGLSSVKALIRRRWRHASNVQRARGRVNSYRLA